MFWSVPRTWEESQLGPAIRGLHESWSLLHLKGGSATRMPTVFFQSTCFHGCVRDVINLDMWLMQQYHNFTPSLVTQGEKQHSCPGNCAVLKVHGTLGTVCFSQGCHCSAFLSLKDKKCLKECLCFPCKSQTVEVNLPLGTFWHPRCRAGPSSMQGCSLAVPQHLQSSWNRFVLQQGAVQQLTEYVISTKPASKGGRKKGKIHYPVCFGPLWDMVCLFLN